MMGRRPYDGRSRREIRNQILAKQAYIRQEMIPKGWSMEAADFTNRLIQRKPYKRLGKQGIHELKNHNWFKGFDWEGLENKTMKPPFIPNIKNVFEYLRNLTEDFTEADCSMENSLIVRRNSFQDLFNGYECYPNAERKTNYLTGRAEKTKEKSSEVSLAKVDSKNTTKGENIKNAKEVRFSNKKVVKGEEMENKVPESKGKKRISLRKESIERSREIGNKTVCQGTSKKKSANKKMKSKKVSSDLLKSKHMSKTLKKNSLAMSDIEDKMKRISQKAKRNRQSHETKWSKEQSKMGVLGKPSSKWDKQPEKSRNVRHLVQKRTALNKSLSKKGKKSQLNYGTGDSKGNYSMSSKLREEDRNELRCLSKQKSKNDLKGYLSLNSKNFFKNVKKSKEKKLSSSFKKNQKILKLKNPRKMIINRGYYVSPQFDRKRDSKKSVFMSSLNYSRFGSKNGYKHNSYSKQSKRSREQMESLCLGGNFGKRVDIQESLRKASFNGTFFEKMKKFGKKRLQQGRTSNGKKNMSIYLSNNNNSLRKKRLRSHKAAQANYVNSGHLLWNKRRKPMGLNLTMIKRNGNMDNMQSTLLENQKSGKTSLRMGKQAFSRGDIYRQLDEFERLKQQRVDLECRQLNSRGSRKGSAFRKKGDLIREIAEITQSLSCSTNLKKLTSKVQNKENYKQLEKLAQSDGLKSFYTRNQNLSVIRKRSQKQTKRRNLGIISSNVQINNSRLN
jgi:hypothetical protein